MIHENVESVYPTFLRTLTEQTRKFNVPIWQSVKPVILCETVL